MSDVAVKVENLGKKYIIGHQKAGDLRGSVSTKFKSIFGKTSGTKEEFWALRDINFEIKQGEAVGIIGRNGAGKSTLLKILSRITHPSTGRFEINGRVSSLLEVGTGFHQELTGRENIYLNGTILGMKRREITAKFDQIVDFSGVEKFLDTPVKHYSSGMKVRLAFSVAAHLEPEILIIDEVLAVGDAEFQKKCLGKMDEISKNEGRTVLFVSHNLEAIINLCYNTILLNDSRLKMFSSTQNTIEEYLSHLKKNTYLKLGHPIVQWIKVETINNSIEVKLKYNNYICESPPHLGIVVSDITGKPIFGSNPKLAATTMPKYFSKDGLVKVVISSPILRNGIYMISLWFGDGSTDIYEGVNVLSIQIQNAMKMHPEPTKIGAVIPEILWQIE